MNIFITGGGGFIGKHLKEYLDKNYGYTLYAPTHSELDLSDENAVDTYIQSRPIDVIVHAANRGGGRDTLEMANITEYNLRQFFNIAKYENNVRKIISFGSGAEYAKHKPIIKAKEKDSWTALPLDEYGLYKSIASRYIEKSNRMLHLRIFGAYGEYENYRYKFISNAIVKNLLHQPITIGQNVYFDYIYIDDLIRMVDYFIHNDPKEKIYNVSTGKSIDLVSLANLVNETSDFTSDILIKNEGLNNEYTSDNNRILREIEAFRFTSHKEAIIKMRIYFQKNFQSLDIATVLNDPYLMLIDSIWKGK